MEMILNSSASFLAIGVNKSARAHPKDQISAPFQTYVRSQPMPSHVFDENVSCACSTATLCRNIMVGHHAIRTDPSRYCS